MTSSAVRLRRLGALGIFVLGAGGFLLHAKIHWLFNAEGGFEAVNLVPAIATFLSTVVVVRLFLHFKSTATAQLLNGMIVIVGLVTMGHFAIAKAGGIPSFKWLLIDSTLADCVILISQWAIGQMLYEMELDRRANRGLNEEAPRPAWWRFMRPMWWLIHLVAISTVYAIGVKVFH